MSAKHIKSFVCPENKPYHVITKTYYFPIPLAISKPGNLNEYSFCSFVLNEDHVKIQHQSNFSLKAILFGGSTLHHFFPYSYLRFDDIDLNNSVSILKMISYPQIKQIELKDMILDLIQIFIPDFYSFSIKDLVTFMKVMKDPFNIFVQLIYFEFYRDSRFSLIKIVTGIVCKLNLVKIDMFYLLILLNYGKINHRKKQPNDTFFHMTVL